MPQLYSNLVKYSYSTTYLCLVLAVLCSLVVAGVRLASMHTWQHQWINLLTSSHLSCLMCSLASVPFIINHREQRRANTWFKKQRIYSTQQKCELPDFTILGKDASG